VTDKLPTAFAPAETVVRVLARMLDRVKTFNRDIIGYPTPHHPQVLSDQRLEFRAGHMQEELDEFVRASARGDVEEAADGLIDLAYVALGALCEMGCAPEPLFEEVHRANMAKVRGAVSKRGAGDGFDAVKPAGWKGPDHSWLLGVTTQDLRFARRPRLLILGHARHGKDTLAELLRDAFGLRFTSSSLFVAESVMLPAFRKVGVHYPSAEACFEARGSNRAFWYTTIKEHLLEDGALLARQIFEGNEIYCGVRDPRELQAIKDAGLADLIVWVDASGRGVPPEPASSCAVTADDADIIISNDGTVEDLRAKALPFLARVLRLTEV